MASVAADSAAAVDAMETLLEDPDVEEDLRRQVATVVFGTPERFEMILLLRICALGDCAAANDGNGSAARRLVALVQGQAAHVRSVASAAARSLRSLTTAARALQGGAGFDLLFAIVTDDSGEETEGVPAELQGQDPEDLASELTGRLADRSTQRGLIGAIDTAMETAASQEGSTVENPVDRASSEELVATGQASTVSAMYQAMNPSAAPADKEEDKGLLGLGKNGIPMVGGAAGAVVAIVATVVFLRTKRRQRNDKRTVNPRGNNYDGNSDDAVTIDSGENPLHRLGVRGSRRTDLSR